MLQGYIQRPGLVRGNEIVGVTKAMSLDIGMITRHRVVFGGRVCACVLNVQSSSSFIWAQKEVGQL